MDLRLLRYFVAVADERHVGRAAAQLHMTQPPLSRAIKKLENDLGVTLFDRTPRGVTLTDPGIALYDGARALLEQADRLHGRVLAASGPRSLAIGTLADAAELVGGPLVEEFRRRHPDVDVSIHEADLADPTAGLRSDLVDVALTRLPFDDHQITTYRLRSDSVGLVVRDDDPIAGVDAVHVDELSGRKWVSLPGGTDQTWCSYWTVATRDGDAGPTVRTIGECLQAVLWSGASAIAPVNQQMPTGLVVIPARDRPPSHLVVAWKVTRTDPTIRAFVDVATDVFAGHTGPNP